MEAQRRPRKEEQRDLGRLASILAKIPSIPRLSPAAQKAHKKRSHFMAFKMTKIPQSTNAPKTRQEQSKQDAVSETPKGKEKSLSAYDGSKMAHSGLDETGMEPNGHEPTTCQVVELVATKRPLHNGEASTSATDNCVSTIPPTSAPAASATAAAPPVIEKASREHVKKIAHDCYVDLAHPLPSESERAWDAKIHPWLESNLLHSMDDFNCVSIECVMSTIKDGGPMYPTILIMCRNLAQKESIEVLLNRCSLIPKNIQCRTIVFEILKCTSRTILSHPPTVIFSRRRVAIHFSDIQTKNSLYANVARIVPSSRGGLSVFCTIGGILSVNGKCYGLTTAHPFAASGSESQETPTATPGYRIPGRVAHAQWPNSAQGEDLQVNPINATYSRGEDWALVKINLVGMTYNTFHVPGVENPLEVTGYVKTTDLRSGEVWVCAGVSGVQRGFLKHQSASIMISKSLFSVRSISLERPLVDGDSGSWVVCDEKLCGLIFCRMGNGVGCAYMLPIEAVLGSISKYWQSLYPGLPSPNIQVACEEVVDVANKAHEIPPKPGDGPKPSVLETRTSEFSRLSSDEFGKTYETVRKLRDEPKTPTSEMPKLKRSKSSGDEPDLGISPATFSLANALSNTKRRGSGLLDDSGHSTTFDEHAAWDSKAILSLDDGGVRSYSTLLILEEIMKAIIHREKSHPYGPAKSSFHPLRPESSVWLPCHYFDYIGGTGAGGVIAIMLGRLKMNVTDTILACEEVLTEVFKTKHWFPVRSFRFWPKEKYNHLVLEQEIQKIVCRFVPGLPNESGNCPFAFDENQCRTVIVATRQADVRSCIFRTYNNFGMMSIDLAHQGPIWQVARATTANPTFFRPTIIDDLKYYQGRALDVNPTSMIYKEVRNSIIRSNHSIILSIGCGQYSRQFRESERVHREMLGAPGYIRLTVDNGLDQMEEDEWRARGRLRTNIGSLIGRYRSIYRRDPTRTKPKETQLEEPTVKLRPEELRPHEIRPPELRPPELRPHELRHHEFGHEEMFTRYEQPLYRSVPFFTPDSLTSSVSPQKENQTSPKQAAPQDQEPHLTPISPENMSSVTVAVNNESNIPKWFRPKNVTTEAIRKHTRKYLDREDVRSRIKEIADLLVEKRRDRVRSDHERWKKFCYGTDA